MTTKTKKSVSIRTREFSIPEDFRDTTLFDAFADAFTPPEDLPLHQTDYGFMARIRDGNRIREDFHKALIWKNRSKKNHLDR